ncbi:RNA-dependent RNA polymerase, partial [Trametes maxima]
GFHPLVLPILYDKLKRIVNNAINDVVRDFHITVPLSAEVFIIPDPYGVLNEGEIHSSGKNLPATRAIETTPCYRRDVLIYRNPCRLPSDIQKVTAVCCADLSDYLDVIVLPTKGSCSFASMLSGG